MQTGSEDSGDRRFPKFIRHGLLAVLAGALVVFGFSKVLQPREPSYRGKPISFWISAYEYQVSLAAPTSESVTAAKLRIQEARKAISSFGPAALPYLSSAMDSSETALLSRYRQLVNNLPSSWRRHLQPPVRKPLNWLTAGQFFREVADRDGTNALPHLIGIATSKNRQTRRLVILALRCIGGKNPEQTVPLLTQALNDPALEVRFDALGALCDAAPRVPQTTPILRAYLQKAGTNLNDFQRQQIIAALGNTAAATPGIADAAIGSLAGTNSWEKAWAALADWQRSPTPDSKRQVFATFENAFAATNEGPAGSLDYSLQRFNLTDAQERDVLAPVVALGLRAASEETRKQAAQFLAGLGAASRVVTPQLVAALDDPTEDVRRYALWALRAGASDAAPAVPKLISLLKERRLLYEAASVLGQIGPPATSAIPALIEAAHQYDERDYERDRMEVFYALASISPQTSEVMAALLSGLRDRDVIARRGAVQALGKVGRPASNAVPALRTVLFEDEDMHARLDAAEALLKIDRASDSVLEPALVQLLGWTQAEDHEAPTRIARLLGALGPEAASTKAALKKLLAHKTPNARIAGAEALAKTSPADKLECTKTVRELMQHQHRSVRFLAVRAMWRIAPENRDEIKRGLSELLMPNNEMDANGVVRLLEEMGQAAEWAVPQLTGLALTSPDYRVRRAARDAVQRLED